MLDVIGMMAQRDRIIDVLWLCPVLSVLLLSARSCVSVLASVSLSSLDAFCGFCGLAYAWRCLPLPCFRISARVCLPYLRTFGVMLTVLRGIRWRPLLICFLSRLSVLRAI